MRSRIVTKSSTFPASRQVVFEALQKLETLRFVAAPWASFEPIERGDTLVWTPGNTFSFHLKLFGIIPLGIHTIRVLRFELSDVYTQEHNAHVPLWNHQIILNPLDDETIQYTDKVELQAGWKTPFVSLWAKAFYAHRQKRWRQLLSKTE